MTRRESRPRPALLAALAAAFSVGVIGVVTAIAHASGHSGRPDGRTQVVQAGSPLVVTAVRSYPGVGARLVPPAARTFTVMSTTQVDTQLAAFPVVAKLAPGKQPDALRLGLYENLLGTQRADGTTAPSVPRQLAWFAEYDGLNLPTFAAPARYAQSPAPSKPIPAGYSCQIFVATNAVSGAVIDAFDHCGTTPFAVSR